MFSRMARRCTSLDAGAVRPAAEVLEGQRIEPAHRLLLQFDPERPDHLMAELTAGRVADRVLAGFEMAHGAHDVAEADAAALPRQPVAAAGAWGSSDNGLAHRLLQHRFLGAGRGGFTFGDLGLGERDGDALSGSVW